MWLFLFPVMCHEGSKSHNVISLLLLINGSQGGGDLKTVVTSEKDIAAEQADWKIVSIHLLE